jgi:hypothetical protein
MTQINMLDPPGPFDTLATWQRYLADVRRLPDDTLLKAELIEAAEAAVRRLSPTPRHRPE